MANEISQLTNLCQNYYGIASSEWEAKLLKGEGSNRKYYRLTHEANGTTCIGVIGENITENNAFICLTKHFRSKGLSVPELYATSDDGISYIQEDLGDISLYGFIQESIKTGHFSSEVVNSLKDTLKMLPSIQFVGSKGLDFSICYPQSDMDRRAIMWDLNYFKYCFLKFVSADFDEPLLEDDFERIANNILQTSYSTFMVRDFQSRNVMLKDGRPYCIDYQGGRRGPFLYDVASFVWQAKANYPIELKKELVTTYYEELSKFIKVERVDFDKQLQLMVVFRTLQVLGAYGFRGLHEKKQHFIESIPFALNNIKTLIGDGALDEYPHLKEVMLSLCNK